MMAARQLSLCKDLFQAVMRALEPCQQLVPAHFNNSLVESLQHLMLSAVQLQQDTEVRAVRGVLEAALQLLSRVGCLGRIEAFFVADELTAHYQWRLDAAAALCARLSRQTAASAPPAKAAAAGKQQQQTTAEQQPQQLKLPDQQLQVVLSFRRQAVRLCPLLAGSCPPAALEQLAATVRQGLLLVNGHSFLIGQEWQAEVPAMLARAEQLKVVLAHRQAHHLSLLVSLLLLLHAREVAEYEGPARAPRPRSSCSSITGGPGSRVVVLPPRPASAAAVVTVRAAAGAAAAVAAGPGGAKLQLLSGKQPDQQQPQPPVLAAAGLGEVLEEDEDDDPFFMPVGPLLPAAPGGGSSTTGSPDGPTPSPGPLNLPYSLTVGQHAGMPGCGRCNDGADGSQQEADADSEAGTPSSGCSSLMGYVVQARLTQPGAAACGAASAGAVVGGSGGSMTAAGRAAALHPPGDAEQQLLAMAGSPEVAAVLAAALGLEPASPAPGSRAGSFSAAPGCGGGGVGGVGVGVGAVTPREGSGSSSARGSPVGSRPRLVLGRLGSLTSKGTSSAMGGSASCSSAAVAGHVPPPLQSPPPPPPLQQQQQQHVPGWRPWRQQQQASVPSSSLCLQHVALPPGCCRSIGAVCYGSRHITRLALVDVGLTDAAVGDLVDALRVNGSIQQLDLSHNGVEDIGARMLASLLRPQHSSAAALRALLLQHNAIGDDGAAALAASLASGSSRLRRLWLQHNAVGEAGARALAHAMQHNTACIELRLQGGNEDVPPQLGRLVELLAKHNRGVRAYIRGLLARLNASA